MRVDILSIWLTLIIRSKKLLAILKAAEAKKAQMQNKVDDAAPEVSVAT